MAEWIGHLLGVLPSWLFLPAFILFVVLAVLGAWFLAPFGPGAVSADVWPLKPKRQYLGQKKGEKHGKK